MYWRVRKVSPEQVAKTYGVHAVCVVSVLFNLVLFTKIQPSNALSKGQKIEFGSFAEKVARHMTDSTYLTYEQSMRSLMSEVGGEAKTAMLTPGKDGAPSILPRSSAELKATARQLNETKTVSAVLIDEVKVNEADNSGMAPVEVQGRIVEHAAAGSTDPAPFRFKLWIGQVGTAPDLRPIIGKFQEMAPQNPATIVQGQ